jgi:hypothetical protein
MHRHTVLIDLTGQRLAHGRQLRNQIVLGQRDALGRLKEHIDRLFGVGDNAQIRLEAFADLARCNGDMELLAIALIHGDIAGMTVGKAQPCPEHVRGQKHLLRSLTDLMPAWPALSG